jgi:hypothetical protein
MAIKRGYRFPVQHQDVFPKGLMLLGPISPDMEYDRPNIQKTDSATGLLQWVGAVSDPDEEKAKRASFEVVFLAPVRPVPATPELLPGTSIRMIELAGLTAEPRRMGQGEFTYVGFVYRATGIKGDTNSPSTELNPSASTRTSAPKSSGD